MDVLLGLSAFGLSSYLPKCVQPPQTKSSVEPAPMTIRVAACVSFLLLALSIIDSVPMSWMMLMNEQWISIAYRITLLSSVTCVLVIFPAGLGARLVGGSSSSSRTTVDELRKSNTNLGTPTARCRRPCWTTWFCWNLGSLVSKLAMLVCQNIIIRPINRLLGRRSNSNASPSSSSSSILPTTVTTSPASNGVNGGTVFRFPNITPSVLHLRLIPALGSIVAVAVTITVMSTVSPWFVRTTSTTAHHSFHTMPILSITVSWLCSVGIFLSSLVNGFGSVSLPYSCLAGLYLEPISDEAVSKAQQELKQTRKSIADSQNELAQINSGGGLSPSLILESPTSGGDKWKSSSSLASRWSFSSTSEERQTTRRKQLTQEIAFLTTLGQELEQEIYDMLQSKEMAAQARTRWGKIRSWIGISLSILLVIRLIGAAWFLWRHDHPAEKGSKTAGSDLVTMTVLFLIGHNYVSQQQYNTLSQVISLVLTAYLSVSQVRTFVRAVDAVHRRLQQCWRPCYPDDHIDDSSLRFMSLHSRLRSSAYAPIVASLMCCYFLACVVLTKLLVPSAYRRALALALETTSMHSSAMAAAASDVADEEQLLRFFLRIRSYAVNSVFLATALVSMVCLGMMLGLQRHQSMRHRLSTPVVPMESP